MKQAIKTKWLNALRSGKYKQGRGQLRDEEDMFCCLGVLCDIQGRRWHKTLHGEWAIGSGDVEDHGGETNPKLQRDVGGPKMLRKLIQMNDNGKSFQKIADYIEKHL